MSKEKEIERLRSMGYKDNVPFKVNELNGVFVADVDERTVTDVSHRIPGDGLVLGMYDNLLRGVYHREVK